jgi:hypothetical protein
LRHFAVVSVHLRVPPTSTPLKAGQPRPVHPWQQLFR